VVVLARCGCVLRKSWCNVCDMPGALQGAYSMFSRLASCQPASLCDELLGAVLRKAAHVQPVPLFLARIFGSGSSGSSTVLQV
jgi:hypothetical protein